MADGAQRPQRPPEPPAWSRFVTILLLAFLVFLALKMVADGGVRQLSYSQFRERVEQGRVEQVTLEGHQITGQLRSGTGEKEESTRFHTHAPVFASQQLLDFLEKHDVTIHAREAGTAWWGRMLIGFLPWLLILGVIFYFSWRMQQQSQQSSSGLFSIGRSKARRFSRDEPQKTFDDVAGAENAKKDLGEVIEYLRRPEHYRVLGAKLPRGVLMVGPPGTGKTLLARAVAGEAGVPFFSISGSEFIEMFVGVGASRVRDMFRQARREAPSIVFIDELDAIGRSRGTGVGGGHDEREQTLNQILSEMDGFSPHETVIVMAATNRPDVLDPALLRPGRFDRKVAMERPHREAREAILELHTHGMPLAEDVDLETLARRTVGFSGADLENLANEAALLAGRENGDKVTAGHFDRARDKILMGAEREQRLGDDERERVAYHESGHAMAAHLFPRADNPEKVTVIPRGQALGATEQAPDEDRYNLGYREARDRIAVMLGGRVAEQLVFDEVSSGAEQDIEQATRLARRMVARWGMDEEIGPVSFSSTQDEVFLGREISRERDFSDETAHHIDQRVRELILAIERDVGKALGDKRERLEKLASALLEEETLDGERIAEIIDGRD